MPVKSILVFSLFLYVWGCSAPHDNPLDPKSDRYVAPPVEPYVPEFAARVWSEHVASLFPPTDLYQVLAELTNPDITFIVDSVWITYDGRPSIGANRVSNLAWIGRFSGSYFGDAHGLSAVGNPFMFDARDLHDSIYVVGPAYLFRVIESIPSVSEPDSNDVVGPWVTLQWQAFPGLYDFTYRASLIYLRGEPLPDTTLWTSAVLPDSVHDAQVPDSLHNGNYQWTITVIDLFDNSSRSKEGLFSVMAGVPQ